jgi:peroxin-6
MVLITSESAHSVCISINPTLYPSYPASPVRANEVVFFVITNVEYDVPSNDVNASSPDMYIGSTIGELGCWVDSAFTHMIQAGVEHSRVPDVGTYMGLGEFARISE